LNSGHQIGEWRVQVTTTRSRDCPFPRLPRVPLLGLGSSPMPCLKPFAIHSRCYEIDLSPFSTKISCLLYRKFCRRRLLDCPHHEGRREMFELERPLLHVAHASRGPSPILHWFGPRRY
jgi:hypothetical protein